ncbi:glycosyltransferase family A protein [Chloroflexota bacterium]
MPRIGMNPSRGKRMEHAPSRITLAILTYLPVEIGYFEHRFNVTRLCLESLISNTQTGNDLMVFDNGSCPRLTNYLKGLYETGNLQYLFLSKKNIGKMAALQIIFNSAPGEIVAYSDDDVFFLPGWLDSHMELLENYPNVGLVTGFYIRSHLLYGTQSLDRFALRNDVDVERGILVDELVEHHYVENMSRTWEQYQLEVEGLEDIRFTYKSIQALASSGHHQFVARKKIIQEALPNNSNGMLMGSMIELENRIDELGFLRLSTNETSTCLLGNDIDINTVADYKNFIPQTEVALPRNDKLEPRTLLTRNPIVIKLLQRLYNFLHRYLFS